MWGSSSLGSYPHPPSKLEAGSKGKGNLRTIDIGGHVDQTRRLRKELPMMTSWKGQGCEVASGREMTGGIPAFRIMSMRVKGNLMIIQQSVTRVESENERP